VWDAVGVYEAFMGRWSAAVAQALLDAVPLRRGGRCLDIGCGVGSLSRVVADRLAPLELVGIDPSRAFLRQAVQALPHLLPVCADATALPFGASTFDTAVSGLVLNFVPDAHRALVEVARVLRSGGVFAAYVWDYDHPDFFLARLWAGLAAVHGERSVADERGRWAVCTIEGLTEVTEGSGLSDVRVRPITIDTFFPDRQAVWDAFLLGVGPAGRAVGALDVPIRARLRQWLLDDLPSSKDGTMRLTGRALAATAVRR
jgi:SAM-dependent methyltransferase